MNVGTGQDVTIQAAETVADVVGYRGAIRWDSSKPDVTPRKLLDVGKMSYLGWKSKTPLRLGIEEVYADFQSAWEQDALRS